MQSAFSQHPRVFLTYSNEDGAFARQLQQDLEAAGAVVRDTAGQAREAAGAEVIKQYEWVVGILTPTGVASSRVQSEVFTALGAQRAGEGALRGVLLFVLKPSDPVTIPPLWALLKRIDATGAYSMGLAELLARLGLSALAPSPAAGQEQPPDTVRGWDGTPPLAAPGAEPDSVGGLGDIPLGATLPDAEATRESKEEKESPPAAKTADEERMRTAAAPPEPEEAAVVRGGDDTPTMVEPGRREAPAPEPVPPPASSAAPQLPQLPQLPQSPQSPPPPPPPPASPPVPPEYMPSPYPSAPPLPSEREGAAPGPGGFAPPAYPPAQSYPTGGYPPPMSGYPPPAYNAPPNPLAPAPQGGYGYPGPFASWPAAPVAVAEQVTFTAYHVREISPQAWEPLYVYISLDTPQALAQVQAAAQQALAGRMGEFRQAAAAETSWLRRGAQLTFVPSVPGCVFNPPELTVPWQTDVQQLGFGMQAVTARPGFAVNGSIQVFTGPLLRADIPISIFVRQPGAFGQAPQQPRSFASSAARAYRRVFASYSHRDTSVVQSCETAAQVTGDRYLRDVTLLRSGEQWNDRLLQAIGEADLFQLFWSENAAHSPAVQTEWRHALALQQARGNFIRPVYWSKQLYPVPQELQPIHFERLSLARLGWGKVRIFLHDVFGLG